MSPSEHGLSAEQQADLRTVRLPSSMHCDLKDFLAYIQTQVDKLTASGEISVPKQGYGFATTDVLPTELFMTGVHPEDPRTYISTMFAHGGAPTRYAWNAVRKIYELLHLRRQGYSVTSTLEAVQNRPEILRPGVPSKNPDGTVPWGPFPWGGAVIMSKDGFTVCCAFSVWSQNEDDMVARLAAEYLLLNRYTP